MSGRRQRASTVSLLDSAVKADERVRVSGKCWWVLEFSLGESGEGTGTLTSMVITDERVLWASDGTDACHSFDIAGVGRELVAQVEEGPPIVVYETAATTGLRHYAFVFKEGLNDLLRLKIHHLMYVTDPDAPRFMAGRHEFRRRQSSDLSEWSDCPMCGRSELRKAHGACHCLWCGRIYVPASVTPVVEPEAPTAAVLKGVRGAYQPGMPDDLRIAAYTYPSPEEAEASGPAAVWASELMLSEDLEDITEAYRESFPDNGWRPLLSRA